MIAGVARGRGIQLASLLALCSACGAEPAAEEVRAGCLDDCGGEGLIDADDWVRIRESANGWASVYPAGAGTTNGGANTDRAHVYVVRNRSELIRALYPDAVIHENGRFDSARGPDPTPKVLWISGTIDLSSDAAGVPLGYEDYRDPGYDFDAYVAAYAPAVWNADPANWDAARDRPKRVAGPLEAARDSSSINQQLTTRIPVGSNTTLFGDEGALILHGSLLLPEGTDNVVIRHVTFRNAFDHFPVWDPADSFVLDTTKPGCQASYVDPNTGPQRCPGGRWNALYSGVIVAGAQHVWVDHCSFDDGERFDADFPSVFGYPHVGLDYVVQHHDGTVDVVGKSDYVTLSYNSFSNHDKTNLIGDVDTPTAAAGLGHLSVTLHHNLYVDAGQRMPRVRFGKVHVYNNYYSGKVSYLGQYAPIDAPTLPTNRFLYGIGIGYLAKLYVENNVFEVSAAPDVTLDDSVLFFNWYKAAPTSGTGLDVGESTYFRDSGTLFNGQAKSIFAAANAAAALGGKPALLPTETIWAPASTYPYTLDESSTVPLDVPSRAGAGKF